jgi:SulP family sulfate permease
MIKQRLSRTVETKNNLLSGFTVALAMVPEAIAFAFVAHLDPMIGLYTAVIIGFITAAFGGRPGMISGATGAMAVVVVSLVDMHGAQYLFAAVLFAGILQILAGVFKVGRFIRIVPHPVMIGFVNGLAVIIFLAQMGQFKHLNSAGELAWIHGSALWIMLGLVGVTMLIIHFLPKLTKAVPSSLAAIVVVTLLVHFTGIDTRNVLDFVRTMSHNSQATLDGHFPSFHIPNVPFTWHTFMIILPYSIILAAVSLLETLLTLTVVDDMTETRGNSTRESYAQGIANVICAFFSGMGGGAMIGQSMINIRSQGTGRLSGITGALGLLLCIVFFTKYIEMIPLAALVGVMFMVVIGTFKWASLKMIRQIPKHDFFTIALVTVVTVFTDLATAVLIGILYSALIFAWEQAKFITETHTTNENGEKVYKIRGPLFFSSVTPFLALFNIEKDPQLVLVDMSHSRVSDHSAIEALNQLADRYALHDKKIRVINLNDRCQAHLNKAQSLLRFEHVLG